jgi:hypothetical protein
MILRLLLRMQGGILFLEGDPDGGFPDPLNGRLFSASASGLVIGTQAPDEGETAVIIARDSTLSDAELASLHISFECALFVTGGKVRILGAQVEPYAEVLVDHGVVLVRVSVDHPVSPSRVAILLSPQAQSKESAFLTER